MKTVTVTLDDTDYVVPKLNIGQLERVTDVLGSARPGYTILRIALERASPAIADVGAMEPGQDEISKAVREIMLLSGFDLDSSKDKPKNGDAPATPGAAS